MEEKGNNISYLIYAKEEKKENIAKLTLLLLTKQLNIQCYFLLIYLIFNLFLLHSKTKHTNEKHQQTS